MKINKVINLLEEQYPANGADQEDFIGLQVGNEESDITGILVTLDVTLEVINQAIDSNSNLIISHHPLVFDELDSKNIDKYTMAKIEMLNKLNIAVFVIHTNADWAPTSIAYNQAIVLGLKSVEQGNLNEYVVGDLVKELASIELINMIKETFELDYDIRTNLLGNEKVNSVAIASGAAGSLVSAEYKQDVLIVGEMKHHQWVYANEQGKQVIEIGHSTEGIFKDMIQVFLEKEGIEAEVSKEQNEFKTI